MKENEAWEKYDQIMATEEAQRLISDIPEKHRQQVKQALGEIFTRLTSVKTKF